MSKNGWGWKNFLAEVNIDKGVKFPAVIKYWMRIGVPVLVSIILIKGWLPIVSTWFDLGG